jgi:hypothetical protein
VRFRPGVKTDHFVMSKQTKNTRETRMKHMAIVNQIDQLRTSKNYKNYDHLNLKQDMGFDTKKARNLMNLYIYVASRGVRAANLLGKQSGKGRTNINIPTLNGNVDVNSINSHLSHVAKKIFSILISQMGKTVKKKTKPRLNRPWSFVSLNQELVEFVLDEADQIIIDSLSMYGIEINNIKLIDVPFSTSREVIALFRDEYDINNPDNARSIIDNDENSFMIFSLVESGIWYGVLFNHFIQVFMKTYNIKYDSTLDEIVVPEENQAKSDLLFGENGLFSEELGRIKARLSNYDLHFVGKTKKISLPLKDRLSIGQKTYDFLIDKGDYSIYTSDSGTNVLVHKRTGEYQNLTGKNKIYRDITLKSKAAPIPRSQITIDGDNVIYSGYTFSHSKDVEYEVNGMLKQYTIFANREKDIPKNLFVIYRIDNNYYNEGSISGSHQFNIVFSNHVNSKLGNTYTTTMPLSDIPSDLTFNPTSPFGQITLRKVVSSISRRGLESESTTNLGLFMRANRKFKEEKKKISEEIAIRNRGREAYKEKVKVIPPYDMFDNVLNNLNEEETALEIYIKDQLIYHFTRSVFSYINEDVSE